MKPPRSTVPELIERYGTSWQCDKCRQRLLIDEFLSTSGRFNGFCSTCRRTYGGEAMRHGEPSVAEPKRAKHCAKCRKQRAPWSFLGANGAETKWCHECRGRPGKDAQTLTRAEYYQRDRHRTG